MEVLIDILFSYSFQRLIQFSSVTSKRGFSLIISLMGSLGVLGLCFLRFTSNWNMNTLHHHRAVVRLDTFTSIFVNRGELHRSKTMQWNPNGRQEGTLGWRNYGKSFLRREYLWRSTNQNTPRRCFHPTVPSASLGELATFYNERFSPWILLSILKAMMSERRIVLEVAFFRPAITPFPTQPPFISVLRHSQIHRRGLAIKWKQRRTVQCLLLLIAKRKRCVQIDLDRWNEQLRRGLAQSFALFAKQLVHLIPWFSKSWFSSYWLRFFRRKRPAYSFFHAAQCIQRATSGISHQSPPSNNPDRARCDVALPFWGFADPAVSSAFPSFPRYFLRFAEIFLWVCVLIWIAAISLPAIGFFFSRAKRLEQKGEWMSEYLAWKIEIRFADGIFVQIAEVDIVRHAHSLFLLLSIHRSPHRHFEHRTDTLIGEVPRRSTHAIHQVVRSI